MNPSKIWLSSPHMGENEYKYVTQAFETNWIAPIGPHLNAFEEQIKNYIQIEHVAALSSGTAAIHLALLLLGIQAGDEVICSSFTFAASANPITYEKAIPVFVDSESTTWNMCPDLLGECIEDRIANGKMPKAIIVVHLYGMPAQMDRIMAIANKYEIPVIEDAAEALGSTLNGKKMGSYGEFGIISFNGNKIITTSGGGALASNDPKMIEKAKFLATQARDPFPHYEHTHIGYNYRMSNVVAGIGRGQMEVIDLRVSQRRANFEFYKNTLGKIKGIQLLEEPQGFHSNRWLTCVTFDLSLFGTGIHDKVRTELDKLNIETRPLWKPMHLQPVFADCPAYTNGVSETLFNQGLCLPSGSNLTQIDLERVVEAISNVLTKS